MASSGPSSTSPPSAAANKFVGLYGDNGRTLILRSDDDLKLLLPQAHKQAKVAGALQYPRRIVINEAWGVAAAEGHDLPFYRQFALAIETSGYGGMLTRCGQRNDEGEQVPKCKFTTTCATRATRDANPQLVAARESEGLGVEAMFPEPYQFAMWYKADTKPFLNARGERRESQQWLPVAVDTNCMWAKGVCACSSYQSIMTANTHDVHKLAECAPGQQSDLDRANNHTMSMWFRDIFAGDLFNPAL